MSSPKSIFEIAQFEDMYGNKVGDDNAWHAHVREVLGVGGKGDWMDISVPGE